MTTEYLLTRLVKTARASRKAQKEYYAHPGKLREDPIKKGLYEESRRREYDLDKLLVEVEKLFPVPSE